MATKNYYIGKFDEAEALRSTRVRAFKDKWQDMRLILTQGHYARELQRHQAHMREILLKPDTKTEYINMVGNYMIFYMLKLGAEDKVIEFRKTAQL